MTVEQGVAFMTEKVLMSEAVARSEVRRYCAWPTQAASYLTGSLEIEALRDQLQARRGQGRPAGLP